jgi:hypothetical protein
MPIEFVGFKQKENLGKNEKSLKPKLYGKVLYIQKVCYV